MHRPLQHVLFLVLLYMSTLDNGVKWAHSFAGPFNLKAIKNENCRWIRGLYWQNDAKLKENQVRLLLFLFFCFKHHQIPNSFLSAPLSSLSLESIRFSFFRQREERNNTNRTHHHHKKKKWTAVMRTVQQRLNTYGDTINMSLERTSALLLLLSTSKLLLTL